MPRLVPSKGIIRFSTPNPEEFQRGLFYELANAKQWNQDIITMSLRGSGGWVCKCLEIWEISWDGKNVVVKSKEPKVIIRKGLYFHMGHGTLVYEAL